MPIGRRSTDRTEGITDTIFKSRAMKDMVPPTTKDTGLSRINMREPIPQPHRLHIYTTKHNTHITLARPNTEPILAFSAGNIGFRKGQRGSYDAAFQLASYVFKMMKDRALLQDSNERNMDFDDLDMKIEDPIRNLEIVLRGFGKGKEAVVKAIMGNEGRNLRSKIIRFSYKLQFAQPTAAKDEMVFWSLPGKLAHFESEG
ncbi:hypothetical protein FKW77_002763 [Venturia effusa]|uniref:Uncharacterized protein n=1 Tax=Venturia effusa TaxID=50376 RepID=A0A517LF78_9PEZI|nr:hypothetical protein FKW77_002763 [Venturia effusa]